MPPWPHNFSGTQEKRLRSARPRDITGYRSKTAAPAAAAGPGDIDDRIRMHILAIEEKIAALPESGPVCGGTSRQVATVEADRINNQTLELSALAGALGAATGARVGLLLAAAVLGTPAELVNERI